MATRQQIRSRAYGLISQEEGSSALTASEMNGFADEGVRFLAPLIKWPRDFIEIAVETNTPAYTLPRDTVLIRTAYFGDTATAGDVQPLDILDETALAAVVPNWMDETTGTQGRPRRIILLDRATVLVNPRPNSAENGKKLFLGYVYLPETMSDDSTEPDLPISYHDLIVDYITYRCYNGKLSNPQEADRILSSIVTRSKLLEPVVTKENDQLKMTWGNADSMDVDQDFGITFG